MASATEGRLADNAAMKVLNLRCADEHAFEGWFASEDDFSAQLAGGTLACPLCGSTAIERLPSAPRIQITRNSAPGHPNRLPARR